VDQNTRYGLGIEPLDRTLRAADRDRDAIAAILRREHLVGRIDDDELEERLERCFTAKRYSELDALIADFPAPARVAPPATSRRGRQVAAILLVALVALVWLMALVGWAMRGHSYFVFARPGVPALNAPGSPNPPVPPQSPTSP
jgi:hypothetical protein